MAPSLGLPPPRWAFPIRATVPSDALVVADAQALTTTTATPVLSPRRIESLRYGYVPSRDLRDSSRTRIEIRSSSEA